MQVPSSFYYGLVLYVICLLLIGLYVAFRKKASSIEGMFIGGKSLGGIASFLSAGATFSSGYVYSAMIGASFLAGWGASWYMIGDVIGTFVTFILCSKALYRMGSRFNSVTLLDFICDRLEDKKNYLRLLHLNIWQQLKWVLDLALIIQLVFYYVQQLSLFIHW